MFFKSLLLLCTILVSANIVNADVDCTKPPHPHSVKISQCCNANYVVNEELKEQCLNKVSTDEFDDEPKPQHLPPRLGCLYECVINETGIYSYESQSIVEDRLDDFLNDGFAMTPEIVPVAKQALQKCSEKQKDIMSKISDAHLPHPPGHMHRHHCKVFIFECMKFEIVKNCPNEYWSESEDCNNLREFMNNCQLPPPPPHHHHHPPGGEPDPNYTEN